MAITFNAEYWIKKLNLTRHIEGGYFRESYKAIEKIEKQSLPDRYDGNRSFSSSIYYLLKYDEVSKIHRILSDEMWYFHCGSSATLYMFGNNQSMVIKKLGLKIDEFEFPQVLIPKGTYFGAEVNDKKSFILASCHVSPGFDYNDYNIPKKELMISEYPKYTNIINKLL